MHTETKWKVSDWLSVSLEIMENGILVLSRAEYTVVRSVTQNPIILLSVLAKSETNVPGLAWVCCKIAKDWAHFRDFPIVAEQGNEAGNRIFCAKKT